MYNHNIESLVFKIIKKTEKGREKVANAQESSHSEDTVKQSLRYFLSMCALLIGLTLFYVQKIILKGMDRC